MTEAPFKLEDKTKEKPKHILWAFREVKGTKADLIAAVNAAEIADHRKAFLVAEIELLEGGAFRMDSHAMSEHSGEVGAHIHITKIF